MKVFFELYKRYAKIAAAEALTVMQGKKIKLFDNELLLTDTNLSAFSRLGLSHAVYQFLFACKTQQLDETIAKFNWQKHYKKNFKVIVHHATNEQQHAIGHIVANKILNSKAEMKNPKTQFHFFFFSNKVIAGKLLWRNTEDFESRKVHRWPAPHPTGTHPQLARAMINLTGATRELVDPFCGAGGTLIEAGLMKLTPIGYDILPALLLKAAKNLEGFKIKNYKLALKDARTLKGKIPYIVADLPYGRNTPRKGLEELYSAFLSRLKKSSTKRAVIGFPNTINYKPLLKKSKLKIIDEFEWYINHKLSKRLVVVEAQ